MLSDILVHIQHRHQVGSRNFSLYTIRDEYIYSAFVVSFLCISRIYNSFRTLFRHQSRKWTLLNIESHYFVVPGSICIVQTQLPRLFCIFAIYQSTRKINIPRSIAVRQLNTFPTCICIYLYQSVLSIMIYIQGTNKMMETLSSKVLLSSNFSSVVVSLSTSHHEQAFRLVADDVDYVGGHCYRNVLRRITRSGQRVAPAYNGQHARRRWTYWSQFTELVYRVNRTPLCSAIRRASSILDYTQQEML